MVRDAIFAYLIRMDFQIADELAEARTDFFYHQDSYSALKVIAAAERSKLIKKVAHDICAIFSGSFL